MASIGLRVSRAHTEEAASWCEICVMLVFEVYFAAARAQAVLLIIVAWGPWTVVHFM